jgi:hypothetical protein
MQQEVAMTPEQIPEFIREIVEIGCDPIAVPGVGWVIGDADLPARKRRAVQPELERICDAYGERDHLRNDIMAHLISIGRYYLPQVQH